MPTRRSLPVLDGAGSAQARPASSLWRSLEERLRGGPDRADVAAEFAPGASLPPDRGLSRRSFAQLLSASAALAGLSGCVRRPREQALPYTRQPEEVTPGRAQHYATASLLGGTATGLIVTSNEGRPTKIEGNPDHPEGRGATGLFHQAQLLSLYDPQRARTVQLRGQDRSWRAFLAAQLDRARVLQQTGGAGLRFLVEPSSSPLLGHLRERILQQFPQARFVAWSSLSGDGATAAARTAFGAQLEPQLELAQAKVICALDADLLASQPGTLRHQGAFADGRVLGEEMNRLYAVETALTATGSAADHRLGLRPSEFPAFARHLLRRVAAPGKSAELSRLTARDGDPAGTSGLTAEQAKFAEALARDLIKESGRSLVAVGPRQPASVHLVAHAINAALGNAGKTVTYAPTALLDTDSGPGGLAQLCAEIRAGAVDTLFITAWNPAYGAPRDLGLAALLGRVPNTVYLGQYRDETAQNATWFVPAAHELESWGDGRAPDGTVTFQQPLIAPLFNGVTPADLFASLLGEGERGTHALLHAFWRTSPGFSDSAWEGWIGDGLIKGSARAAAPPTEVRWPAIQTALAAAEQPAPPPRAPGAQPPLELSFLADPKVWDGRFANNAWLQELPDPMTRLTWENAALFAPSTARFHGVENGDEIELAVGGRSLRAPVLIAPGQAVGAITLQLGYGRAGDGEQLARGLGFDAGALRTVQSFWSAQGVQLTRLTRGQHQLAQTQEHHSMEGRAIALSFPLEELAGKGHEELAELRAPVPTLHPPTAYLGFQWAMAIDLARCTGCNACALACQAENNIPVVGKDGVIKSREMNWLRIDRYFEGPEDNPEVITQPLMCMHCEMAPCEYVCPVNATVHSDEGLNEMVYNRCVGTRYCSNNCPYKVRRFNFFAYTNDYSDTERMVMNPDVTVRARGVMEKCTYCVQRIERVRIDTRVAGSEIQDGDIRTACQQVCPASAITFGSLHDPHSAVARLHQDPRRYDLLHDLGTRPRTAYLARVRNLNPELT